MWSKISKNLILFPLLFAIFPVLTLYAHNIVEVAFESVIRSLVLSLTGAVLILLISFFFTRDLSKAGAITTLILVLFFSYGHVYHYLKRDLGLNAEIVRHRYLLVIYVGVFVVGVIGILRVIKISDPAIKWFNVISAALLIYPLIQIINYHLKVTTELNISASLFPNENSLDVQNVDDLPDIYYIILDTYTRADSLQKELGFDNSEFLVQMEEKGFFTGECSRSNYTNTADSLTSSLNMNYLSDLKQLLAEEGLDETNLRLLIRHSLLRELLEGVGYKTVAFDTGYEWTRLRDAHAYLTPDSEPVQSQIIEPFELLQLETTAGLLLVDNWRLSAIEQKQNIFQELTNPEVRYGEHIRLELYLLDTLPTVASLPGPKFVFAHVLIPHVPRVFGPQGEILTDPGFNMGELAGAVNEEYDLIGYLNEIEFINREMLKISQEIISNSRVPPIIVIQGDTGKSGQNMVEILNLFYTQGEVNADLYPSISPVNTFRILLNSYLGADFELLPDETWVDDKLIPERWSACKEN
jgi:hypothetical protein